MSDLLSSLFALFAPLVVVLREYNGLPEQTVAVISYLSAAGLLTYVGVRIAQLCSTTNSNLLTKRVSNALPAAVGATRTQFVEPSLRDSSSAEALKTGLAKTRAGLLQRLRSLFSGSKLSGEDLLASLEEILITSDLGVKTTATLLDGLRQLADLADFSESMLRSRLQESIEAILASEIESGIVPLTQSGKPFVILVVGVNGAGKTTTIGKLAQLFTTAGHSVLLAAGDTFRAAATSQIEVWAERSGAELVAGKDGAKPSTVVYQAIERAKSGGHDVLIIDTAGRLHTRVNLMNELKALTGLISRELPGAPHETLLVVDATSGQNALQQAREFNAIAPLTGVIVTKLDGTSKGGIVVAIKNEIGVPIRYIGVGERIEDLRPFSASEFSASIFN